MPTPVRLSLNARLMLITGGTPHHPQTVHRPCILRLPLPPYPHVSHHLGHYRRATYRTASANFTPVSYTHLRAPQTVLTL